VTLVLAPSPVARSARFRRLARFELERSRLDAAGRAAACIGWSDTWRGAPRGRPRGGWSRATRRSTPSRGRRSRRCGGWRSRRGPA